MRGVGGHSRLLSPCHFSPRTSKSHFFDHPPPPPSRGGTPRTTKILGKGDLCHSKDLKNAKMGAFDKGEGGVGVPPWRYIGNAHPRPAVYWYFWPTTHTIYYFKHYALYHFTSLILVFVCLSKRY